MFLLVSVRHVGAHPGEHQHGVSIQIFISLGKTFLRISRIRNIPMYMYLLSFLRFWTLSIFSFLFWSILNGVTLKTSNWENKTYKLKRRILHTVVKESSWTNSGQILLHQYEILSLRRRSPSWLNARSGEEREERAVLTRRLSSQTCHSGKKISKNIPPNLSSFFPQWVFYQSKFFTILAKVSCNRPYTQITLTFKTRLSFICILRIKIILLSTAFYLASPSNRGWYNQRRREICLYCSLMLAVVVRFSTALGLLFK